MSNGPAIPEDLAQIFDDGFDENYQVEAQRRWGNSPAWTQSKARTSRYTAQDWRLVKAEQDDVHQAFLAAMDAGPANSPAAMDAAEAHRRHIAARFYDLGHEMHRGLADMYLSDPRFTATYDNQRPGLAQFVHDAIHANADRADREGATGASR